MSGGAGGRLRPLDAAPVPDPLLVVRRRLGWSALIGLLVWAGLWGVPLGGGPEALVLRLVLLAPLALFPLFLDAAATPADAADPALRLASWLVLPGALAAAASLLRPVGTVAGALVAAWGLATLAVAAWGVRRTWRLWQGGRLDAPEAVLGAGLVALPGGAVWLALARAGIDPGGYGALVVALTSAHFHYAASVAPLWAGLLGRRLVREAPALRGPFTVCAGGLVVGTPLVAAGITLAGVPGGGTLVETAGVVLLTLGAMGLGLMGLAVASRLPDRVGALMVGVSAASLVVAMGLALLFNVGPRLGVGVADVGWMLPRHGWLNAVGFGLWGAMGWRRLR